jgi:hypothetical protein
MSQVLIIVLNHNKKDMVMECIASLARQSYVPVHVVVVDNASTDGSREAITKSYPNIDLLCKDRNLGAIGGRNEGYAYGKQKGNFEFVLFLDDDAEVAAGSIGSLVAALNHDVNAGISCGKTYINFQSNTLMSAGISARLYLGLCRDRGAGKEDRGQFNSDGYVDACGSFAMMIRAALFEELGGFDEIFTPYGWEDVDLCLRASARGQLTRYVPAAIFAHKGTRLGRGPIAAYERHKAKNFLKLLRRHTSPLQKLTAAIFVPLRGLLLLSRFALHGHWRAIPSQLKGVLDYLRSSRD